MDQSPRFSPSTSLPRETFSGYREGRAGGFIEPLPTPSDPVCDRPSAWHGTQHPRHRVNRCVFSAPTAKIPQMKYFCPKRSSTPGNLLKHRRATGAPTVDPGMWAPHTICLAPLAPPLRPLCPHSQSSAPPCCQFLVLFPPEALCTLHCHPWNTLWGARLMLALSPPSADICFLWPPTLPNKGPHLRVF